MFGTSAVEIEGRRVVLRLRALSRELRAPARDAILDYCRSARVARLFPLLVFEARTPKDSVDANMKAWVDIDDSTPRVFIRPRFLRAVCEVQANLGSILEHELTHLVQIHSSTNLSRVRAKLARLPRISSSPKDRSQLLAALRTSLADLIRSLQMEGLAVLAQKSHGREIQYSKGGLRDSYSEALRAAEDYVRVFHDALVEQRHFDGAYNTLAILQNKVMYALGFHMAYVLIFSGMDFETMLGWSDHRFLKEYERAVREFDVDPLVTLRSKGVLCYDALLKELQRD